MPVLQGIHAKTERRQLLSNRGGTAAGERIQSGIPGPSRHGESKNGLNNDCFAGKIPPLSKAI